jgi:putative glutamine amidotransferase
MQLNKDNYVFVANDTADMGSSYFIPFDFLGKKTNNLEFVLNEPKKINLIVFTGGADVDPIYYEEPLGSRTFINEKRDKYELAVLEFALKNDIPMFGICRGLQFLNVHLGGKLIQHTTDHNRKHNMTTIEGDIFEVTSSHHQMCLVDSQHEIIGWSTTRLSKSYLNGWDEEIPPPRFEVEAVKFNKVKALGVQYHPEVMNRSSMGFMYVENIIKKYLL